MSSDGGSGGGGGGVDIWVGRLAMMGFVGALVMEVATGKGLLERHVGYVDIKITCSAMSYFLYTTVLVCAAFIISPTLITSLSGIHPLPSLPLCSIHNSPTPPFDWSAHAAACPGAGTGGCHGGIHCCWCLLLSFSPLSILLPHPPSQLIGVPTPLPALALVIVAATGALTAFGVFRSSQD
ncbi:unnamed protein product [Closterium sp. NIES-54]